MTNMRYDDVFPYASNMLGAAKAISNLKLSMTDPLTGVGDRRCYGI